MGPRGQRLVHTALSVRPLSQLKKDRRQDEDSPSVDSTDTGTTDVCKPQRVPRTDHQRGSMSEVEGDPDSSLNLSRRVEVLDERIIVSDFSRLVGVTSLGDD